MVNRSEVKLKRGLSEALDRAREAARREVEESAQRVRNAAPVDTGALRASVTVEETPDGARLIVGDGSVDYAEYVERGTRYMSPQPFVGPATAQLREEVVDAVQRAVNERGR